MFFELIAAVAAGFAGAGIALLLNKVLGGRMPRWTVPVAAGLAMLGTTIASEYAWYERTVAALPEGLEVAATAENRAFYRPWTYVAPFVSRFLAVDVAAMRTNDAVPGQRMVEVYAFGRWSGTQRRVVMIDCTDGRRADLADGTTFGDDGIVEGLQWRDTGHEDPLVRTSCEPR
ncbi:MAG: hypothetical protein AAGF59_02590 [Pseudomonadota bacterium]